MLVIYFHVCCTCKGLDKLKVPMLKEIFKKFLGQSGYTTEQWYG